MSVAVGWIGVGLMGHGAAKNLLEKGHPLTILGHRNRAPVDDLVGRGAVEVASPAEVAARSEVVFTCLPSAAEVEAVVHGENGLLGAMRPGSVLVDTTTCDPNSTRATGAALAARGVAMLDAALGRTPKEAEAGRLSTYVGGDPAVIARIRPLFECYADTIVVCGELGAGHTCKLVNNSVTIGTCALFAEALATAAKLGVDMEAQAAVLSAGGANGGMWAVMKPWLLAGDDSYLQAPMRIAAKDMRTYNRMAEQAGVSTFIAQAINQTYRLVLNGGHSETYMPRLPGILAALNGAKLREFEP